MRLLATVPHSDEAIRFTKYLAKQGIETQVDQEIGSDWGSQDYGTAHFKIWVIHEDQIKEAQRMYEQFQQDPFSPLYDITPIRVTLPKQEKRLKKQPYQASPVTAYLIALCIAVYAWSSFTSPQFTSQATSQTYSPIYTSPLQQQLLFDFPKTYVILDQLVSTYGIDALTNSQNLPPKGGALVQELKTTPFWQGYYEEFLSYLTQGHFLPKSPWFEKISEGEVWRLVSPIFLHGDIFHILFNMAWLYILGKQLELHLKPVRYLIFILIAAALTNTAQYLISGPNFIGFSGVVCAMLSFIWMRQKAAPWEGYQIQKSTFTFMMIFIFGMLALQSFAFLLEVATGKTISTSIANGAHVAGLGVGWVFAKLPFFTKRFA